MFNKYHLTYLFLLSPPQSLSESVRRVYYSYSTILPKALPTIRLRCHTAKQKFAVLKYLYQTSNIGTQSSFYQKLSTCQQEQQRLKKVCQCSFFSKTRPDKSSLIIAQR